MSERKNIAVIGAGVAGISAAYALNKKHRVTLFEAADYLGGHTNTIVLDRGSDQGVAIDTGFIVFNDRNYPTFIRFLKSLGLAGQPSDMSFGFHHAEGSFCYSSYVPNGLFANRFNIVNPFFLKMIADIIRFNREAKEDLAKKRMESLSLGEYLKKGKYSNRFKNDYLIPMGAAIWSTPPGKMLEFPAQTFMQFFLNHGLLDLKGRPHWMTVPGGSFQYVKKFLEQFRGNVRVNTPVQAVKRTAAGVSVKLVDEAEEFFDKAVIAVHADQAYKMLAEPTNLERELLGVWEYTRNKTVLHTDASVMPSNKRAWASWNYSVEKQTTRNQSVSLTYWMNLLQTLETKEQYFVTLNRETPIAPQKIIREFMYTHPSYTQSSIRAQARLQELNQSGPVYFCGSYFGYGFHEDAIKSSKEVVNHFGCEL